MSKALGMIEFKTVSSGVTAADKMVKAANVELVEGQVVCPGKYIALFQGDLSAVRAAMDIAETTDSNQLISTFVLGNPHEDIFPAIYGTTRVQNVQALGILESYDAASMVVAADVAAKTSLVHLIELRLAKGMCGKSYLTLTGEVAAVQAAVEKARASIGDQGMYLDSSVIAQPDPQICKSIL